MNAKLQLKVTCILIVMIALSNMLTSCSKAVNPVYDDVSDDDAGEQKAFNALVPYKGEPARVKALVYRVDADIDRNNIQQLQKEYNKQVGNINWEWESLTNEEYSSKLVLYLASGDVPDVFSFSFDNVITKSAMLEYGRQGLLVDWSAYIDRMDYLKKFAGPANLEALKRNMADSKGNMFFMTEVGQPFIHAGWLLRDDIFMKISGRIPDTLDELYEDLLKMKEISPEKYPFSASLFDMTIRNIALNFGAFDDFFYEYDKKKWLYGPAQEGYKSALQCLNKFYRARLLDPEFPALTRDMYEKRVITGETVASYGYNWGKMERSANAKSVPFSYVIKTLKMNNNRKQIVYPWAHYSANVAISSKSKHKDLLAAVIDYQYSPEMVELSSRFDKYTLYHGKLGIRMEPYIVDRSFAGLPDFTGRALVEMDRKLFDNNTGAAGELTYTVKMHPSLSYGENEEFNRQMLSLHAHVKKCTVEFITGSIGFEKWNEYVEGIKNFNIQVLEDYFNKAEERAKLR